MKRLGRAVGKYLWLIILIIIIFVCVIKEFPANYKLLLNPGVVIPNGVLIDSKGHYFESFFMFIEKPNFRKSNDKVSASNPKEVNSYLEKMERYTKDYVLKLFPEIIYMYEVLPVTSEGKDRILIYGSKGKNEGLYLFDTQHNLLHNSDFYGGEQWFVSAKFKDRLWVQEYWGGTSGCLYMYEISIVNDKINIKNFGYGVECEYPTYKIMNHRTNPRMVLYQKAYMWPIYWILYFLLFLSLMLVLGLFLISRKL